ncbi:MAG: DUF2520 domain-containing protein [Bacteroidia bacterium]|nr:DUF2520 domain-containing protein [Bacteroidia bacterium]
MKNPSLKIVLIGAGNVATQLGLAFNKSGYKILQVYSQTSQSARVLALKLRANPIVNLNHLLPTADLYIISVKDDALEHLCKKIRLKNKLIVHTSGSLPINVLRKTSLNYGVLYPLQTLSKNKAINFSSVPLCVEGNTKATESKLKAIAKTLSKQVYSIHSDKRKVLHLAAVFASNFTNHMYALSYKLLKKNAIPFEILLPLIHETADKIKYGNPSQMQTGPAVRNDKLVMKMHLTLLCDEKRMKKLYEAISKSILKNTD